MLTATKRFTFCYGHHLPNYVGKCAQLHGHNAALEVTVKGLPIDGANRKLCQKYPGMVVDFKDLQRIVETEVINPIDHTYIDPEVMGWIPTIENIALWAFWRLLKVFYSNLVKIKISESENSWVQVDYTEEILWKLQERFGKIDATCSDFVGI